MAVWEGLSAFYKLCDGTESGDSVDEMGVCRSLSVVREGGLPAALGSHSRITGQTNFSAMGGTCLPPLVCGHSFADVQERYSDECTVTLTRGFMLAGTVFYSPLQSC